MDDIAQTDELDLLMRSVLVRQESMEKKIDELLAFKHAFEQMMEGLAQNPMVASFLPFPLGGNAEGG